MTTSGLRTSSPGNSLKCGQFLSGLHSNGTPLPSERGSPLPRPANDGDDPFRAFGHIEVGQVRVRGAASGGADPHRCVRCESCFQRLILRGTHHAARLMVQHDFAVAFAQETGVQGQNLLEDRRWRVRRYFGSRASTRPQESPDTQRRHSAPRGRSWDRSRPACAAYDCRPRS